MQETHRKHAQLWVRVHVEKSRNKTNALVIDSFLML